MAEIIRMPEILAGSTEAAVATWLVGPGATVEVGTALAEIETDKAVVEFVSENAGTIGRLLIGEGSTVAVGEPIVVLVSGDDGDGDIDRALASAGVSTAIASDASATPDTEAQSSDPTASTAPPESSAGTTTGTEAARLFASPLVRRLAREQGIDLTGVNGTGPRGRIVRRDLERHIASAEVSRAADSSPDAPAAAQTPPLASPSEPGFEDVPLDRMRRTIARRLTESKSTVPHFYLVADCRIDALLDLRRHVNQAGGHTISINDFVLKAVAGALADVPEANAIWNGDSIRRFSGVDISVAVATEGGLSTPVLRGVDRMTLSAISATVSDLAGRARAGRLLQNELEGGSFSVSNLGMYGTAEFTAILNPPQAGILAVGAARAQPIVDADGQLAVGTVMTVTLSADHRVLDGAVAARWLDAFQKRVESPLSMLV